MFLKADNSFREAMMVLWVRSIGMDYIYYRKSCLCLVLDVSFKLSQYYEYLSVSDN